MQLLFTQISKSDRGDLFSSCLPLAPLWIDMIVALCRPDTGIQHSLVVTNSVNRFVRCAIEWRTIQKQCRTTERTKRTNQKHNWTNLFQGARTKDFWECSWIYRDGWRRLYHNPLIRLLGRIQQLRPTPLPLLWGLPPTPLHHNHQFIATSFLSLSLPITMMLVTRQNWQFRFQLQLHKRVTCAWDWEAEIFSLSVDMERASLFWSDHNMALRMYRRRRQFNLQVGITRQKLGNGGTEKMWFPNTECKSVWSVTTPPWQILALLTRCPLRTAYSSGASNQRPKFLLGTGSCVSSGKNWNGLVFFLKKKSTDIFVPCMHAQLTSDVFRMNENPKTRYLSLKPTKWGLRDRTNKEASQNYLEISWNCFETSWMLTGDRKIKDVEARQKKKETKRGKWSRTRITASFTRHYSWNSLFFQISATVLTSVNVFGHRKKNCIVNEDNIDLSVCAFAAIFRLSIFSITFGSGPIKGGFLWQTIRLRFQPIVAILLPQFTPSGAKGFGRQRSIFFSWSNMKVLPPSPWRFFHRVWYSSVWLKSCGESHSVENG